MRIPKWPFLIGGVLILAALLSAADAPKKTLGATVTGTTITLNWNASTVSNGAPAVTGYNVYRGTTSNGEATTALASVGNITTFVDSTVVAGTTYFYKVTGVNPNGESAKSNEASVTVPNPVPPNAPTGLTATSP